ncbi:MAG: hypothetical protein IPP62_16130 [bacterium]|nr:hypothetical protein [bacterium]
MAVGPTHWWNDTVFYEILVRSFSDSDGDGIGDLQGLTAKLDYLNDGNPATTTDLGITGIWLMPINNAPSYHGYDSLDYRSINPDYGTMADFEAFLAAAHARGIKVIIDYVMNHCSNEHPWFVAARQNSPTYRNWFRWAPPNRTRRGRGPGRVALEPVRLVLRAVLERHARPQLRHAGREDRDAGHGGVVARRHRRGRFPARRRALHRRGPGPAADHARHAAVLAGLQRAHQGGRAGRALGG